ncbi:MAG: hypothetical protein IKM15_01495, partial [Peptococcaceae bacterium]|nr:hypothetical protein [Peptococcaceae bacterium]
MTSNNLSTNMQRYFLQSLKSYWWLMLICGIAYFFAGPVIQVMLMQNNVNYILDESIRQAELLEQTARWFAAEGFLSYYVLASGFAILTAIVLFAYLQHKNQVNFYHSQPIKRQKLFWNQYVIGLLIVFIPMLLMTMVMLILAFMQGGGAAVSLSAVAVHLGRIMLFAVFSYSLTILAGQLTGTVLTHICMTAVLHFCVPVLVLAIQLLCDVFLDTFVTSQHWFDLSFYFSPLCALVDFLSNMNIYYSSAPGDWWYAYESIETLGFSKSITFLALALFFTVASWFLYGKRPSEATGNALVYRISEPVLKFYLMLIAAIVGGILFEEIGRSFFFFVFGALSCGILVHMVCEVIIQKDFRAMLHRLSHAAVFMVIIFALIAVVRWDLFGYDQYLPEENQVAEIRCEFSNLPDSRYNYNNDGEVKGYTGEMISPMLAMLGKVVDNEYYVPENPVEMPNWDYRIRLDVVYVLKSGREVTRSYGSVPAEGIKEDFAAIYNTP